MTMERPSDTCIRVRNDLALFVGGELERGVARELARHLDACSACRDASARARSAQSALVRGLETGRGPDLWPALRAKLDREGLLGSPSSANASSATPIAPRRRLAGARGLFAATAAAALVLLSAWGARAWLDQCLPDASGAPGATGPSELVVDPRGPRGPGGIEPRAGQPIPAMPVADGRLHRLGARDRSLLDDATVLGAEAPVWQLQPARPQDEQPVGLRRIGHGW